jgi:AraC-like DNA-binding protein
MPIRIQKPDQQPPRLTQRGVSAQAGHAGQQPGGAPDQSLKNEKQTSPRLPDFDQRLYPVQKLAAVVGVLGEDGVSASEVLDGSDLTPTDVLSASTRISYRQTIIVYNNAIRLSRDPTIAFRIGRRMHITYYGMYGYALLCCPDCGTSAKFASKYSMAVGPTFGLKFSLDAEWARYEFTEVISQDPTSDLYRFALEYTLAMVVTVTEDLFGRRPALSSMSVMYPPPVHASAYGDLFQCPVSFNAEANEFLVVAAEMETPIACGNPITLELARQACEDILKEAARSGGFASLVRQALVRIPSRFPPAEEIAAELGLSPRQLHRRLQIENTSYRRMLDEVRMDLAIAYLRKTQITTDDIAIKLGFSEGANFRHAFRRWTGKSTSDFRTKGTHS